MTKILGISTGFDYKISGDMNQQIKIIRDLSLEGLINGIELNFAFPEKLFNFEITEDNLNYLRSLKFVSIHLPWKKIIYSDNPRARGVLSSAETLYKIINAKNVVVHTDEIKDFRIFNDYDICVSIENDDYKKGANTVEQIQELLDKNKNLGLTFDFAHAISISNLEVDKYIQEFRQNISEIHLAMLDREMKDHWFLHKFKGDNLDNLIKSLKSLDAPIILECVARDSSELPLIKKEIKYIINILK
ncbi:MAG: hypothetical protein Q8N63_09335 [Nanoarchaeota archaeon]|nr:hypothetical protein [Nanoarchaeota archaeon]